MKQAIEDIYDERYENLGDENISLTRHQGKILIKRCFKYVDLGKNSPLNILDLGCGTGSKTFWLKDFASRVTAIDISSKGIVLAERYNAFDNIEYIVGDSNKLDLPNKYDCITSFGLSVTNLNDVNEIANIIHNYIRKFGAPRTTYIHYSKTDFSGENPGWKYHSHQELTRLIQNIRTLRQIKDCSVIFFLPRNIDLHYDRIIPSFILRTIAFLYHLIRRRKYRFAYIILIQGEN